MGSVVKPGLHQSSDGGPAFERILEREAELLTEVESAHERGRSLITHAQDDRDEITRRTQEEARARAKKESDSIKQTTQEKLDVLKRQHQQESAALRSKLERTIDPAISMVVDLVTGAADSAPLKAQGGDA